MRQKLVELNSNDELAKTVREHFAQLLMDHVQSVVYDLRSY